jgi:hypothetical protein
VKCFLPNRQSCCPLHHIVTFSSHTTRSSSCIGLSATSLKSRYRFHVLADGKVWCLVVSTLSTEDPVRTVSYSLLVKLSIYPEREATTSHQDPREIFDRACTTEARCAPSPYVYSSSPLALRRDISVRLLSTRYSSHTSGLIPKTALGYRTRPEQISSTRIGRHMQ